MENSHNWREVGSLGAKQCFKVLRKLAFACLGCAFALCGAMIGTVLGAVKGQTTETGFSVGAVTGAVGGAIVGMEVLESCLQGVLLSKVAIFSSIANGKTFCELAGEALLQAYEWQNINSIEVSYGESSDIFDVTRNNGLLPETINKLSYFKFSYSKKADSCRDQTTSCAICLQDFKNGVCARKLPACGHIFHVICIDKWLPRHGSCPICRQNVLANIDLSNLAPILSN